MHQHLGSRVSGVDRVGGWIYFALPVNENIDVGRAALPPSMRAIAAQARAEAPKKNEQP